MAFSLAVSAYALDLLGRIEEGTRLEDRFSAIVRAFGEHEPIARLWWNAGLSLRASYAHGDPWRALQHSAEITEPQRHATSPHPRTS